MWLQQSLHAKYFRADDALILGSANITATALGLTSRANLELLQTTTRDQTADAFEHRLFESAIQVDDSFARRMLEMQVELREQELDLPREASGIDEHWLTELPRDPEDLWRRATGDDELLSVIGQSQGMSPLSWWGLGPP